MSEDLELTEEVVGNDVHFTLDIPEITLNRLGELARDIAALLKEIQQDFLPEARVQWRVESISMSSPLQLMSRPISRSESISVPNLEDLSGVASSGLKLIQNQAVRPPYFTDTALERARDIVARVRKLEGVLSVDLTRLDEHVVANVNEVLGSTFSAIGSVEGFLERLNVHGTNRIFNIYDPITGGQIRCEFGNRIPPGEVGRLAKKRVVVHGEIRYRDDGSIVNVLARSIDAFPEEADLPSADDVLGILEG